MIKTLFRKVFPTEDTERVDDPTFEITFGSYIGCHVLDLLPFARISEQPTGYSLTIGWLYWDIRFIYDNGKMPF